MYGEAIKTAIVAQDRDTCDEIMDRIIYAYENLPEVLKNPLKKGTKATRERIEFANGNQITSITVGSKSPGVGKSRDRVHITEGCEMDDETFGRLQEKLRGETPTVRDVWDWQAQTSRWRPIDENGLCDYVVRHLHDDLERCGIVALREVQIRRGFGDGPGQRTDIYVAAVIQEDASGQLSTIRFVLEAKGCWHRELKTAMTSQLRDRYLKENRCQHGLYLVGWFNCDEWDTDDNRRRGAPTWTVEEARQFFNRQARECSDEESSLYAGVLDMAFR